MFVFSSGIMGLAGLTTYCLTVIFESLGKVARFTNINSIAGRVTTSDDINTCIVIAIIVLDLLPIESLLE